MCNHLIITNQKSGIALIAYFSKATIDTEKNYHSFELEILAIVKAIERLRIFTGD